MNDVLALFRQTGALLHGHFVLRSGLHSREFFQCAILLQHAKIASQIYQLLSSDQKAKVADIMAKHQQRMQQHMQNQQAPPDQQ